jgi:hypothetical protein
VRKGDHEQLLVDAGRDGFAGATIVKVPDAKSPDPRRSARERFSVPTVTGATDRSNRFAVLVGG